MKYGALWKSDRFVGTAILLLFLLAFSQRLPLLEATDQLLYDTAASSMANQTSDRIVIVTASQQELQKQHDIAKLIELMAANGTRTIALEPLYHEAGKSDNTLIEQTKLAGNVLMPIHFELGGNATQSSAITPTYISQRSLRLSNPGKRDEMAPSALLMRHPHAALAEVSGGFGHLNLTTDSDGTVRSLPMAIRFLGRYYPSMALTLAAANNNIPMGDLRLNLGTDIELGALNVPVDSRSHIYPAFHSGSYQHYTLAAIINGNVPLTLFKGRIVLIASKQESSMLNSPIGTISRSEYIAHALQSILQEESITRPEWSQYLEFLLLLVAGLYLIVIAPKLSLSTTLISSASAIVLLLVCEPLLLNSSAIWLQTGAAAILIAVGTLAIALLRYMVIKEKQPSGDHDPGETNRLLGLSFQSQGMLEQAYDKFLACPLNDEIAELLYDLALAFERKRQFDEALNVLEKISSFDSSFRDIQTRMISLKNARQSSSDKDSNAGLSSLLASGDNTPTLGRYEIVSELGKGAMGTVYLGRDPKINRKVAIKTLALSKEFASDQLEEVKERFFHEAEIAGMLNHPNIVTIFDAGDEHDLAYIAMEYLDGIDLIPYTKKGKTLPINTTLKIIAKVAEALQYAHEHGVIHRDIKPANIMILKNKSVKVTDFGIAHITESNTARAGTVLGTPSYMSPEQLSGKPVDGRSDLFSLGVTLYELTTGIRPFKAKSLSKLMFKIAKEPHADARTHNPDIPNCVVELINLMLSKKIDQRITSAREVLDRIHDCLQQINGQGGRR